MTHVRRRNPARQFRHACCLALATGMAAVIGCAPDERPASRPTNDDLVRLEDARGPAWDHLPESKDGPERLIGTWEVMRFESGGLAFAGRALAQMRGDKEFQGVAKEFVLGPCWCQFQVNGGDGKPTPIQLPVSMHPELSPHQFDLVGVGGEIVNGIYKLSVDDQLLIAVRRGEAENVAFQQRPKNFDSGTEGTAVIVCRRIQLPK